MSKIYYNKMSRRMFLRSASGALMAIPTLTSLAPKKAFAQSSAPRSYFLFVHPNQGDPNKNHVPNFSGTVSQTTLIPGLPYYSQNIIDILNLQAQQGISQLAPGIPLSTSELALAIKINILRGIDYVNGRHKDHDGGSYWQGNMAAYNGAWTRDEATGIVNKVSQPVTTIDHIFRFEGVLPGDTWTLGGGLSTIYDPSKPIHILGQQPSNIERGYNQMGYSGTSLQTLGSNPQAIFLQFFANTNTGSSSGPNPLVAGVDLILNAFNSVRSGSQISNQDSQTLESHIDKMNDLRTSLQQNSGGGGVSCNTPSGTFMNQQAREITEAMSASDLTAYWDQLVALAAQAIKCNIIDKALFRVQSSPAVGHTRNHRGDPRRWHLEDAHSFIEANITAHVNFVNGLFLDLCRSLNETSSNGQTYLENSFGWSVPECSFGHYSDNYSILTAGNAAGAFQSGKFLSYEDPISFPPANHYIGGSISLGLPVNRYWASILNGFGIQESQYRNSYGNQFRPQARNRGFGFYAQTTNGPLRNFDRSSHPQHFPSIHLPLPGF